METGGQRFNFCSTSSQVIGSEDSEVWIGSGSFGDPFRTSAPMMQTAQRRKRQNCGNSAQGHHSTGLGSAGQLGLGAIATEECLNHSGPIFTGVHRAMNQSSRLSSRGLQFSGFEPGNSTNTRYSFNDGVATEASWNAVPSGLTLQQPVSNSVGSSTNSAYTYIGDQSRNSYKRKSSLDTFPGPLTQRTSPGIGESNFLRFTQGPGARRSDISFNSLSDESGVRRDGQDAYHCFRTSAMPVNRYDGLTTAMTRENYFCPSIVQNDRALLAPRRSDTVNESVGNMGSGIPETLPFRQGCSLSATGPWRRNNTYSEEGSNPSGFFETMRNFNSSSDGNHLRRGEAPDMIDIASVDSRPHQPLNRSIRPAHLREFTSQSCHHLAPNPNAYVGTVNMHSPSFPAAAQPSSRYNNIYTQVLFPPPGPSTTISGMPSGPQAAFGDLSSGSMPGQFLPRYSDTSRSSYLRQVPLRGSRVLPSDGVNRHRFSASHHDWSNQSLAYEWGDAYDQHSDMRLDVDNMSYEELLALEERIGNVNTGVNEDNLQNCLKMTTHSCTDMTFGVNSQESDAKCSICQEEYTEGDELAELQCGHGYHTDCIKQWLLLKNQCPICKAVAC